MRRLIMLGGLPRSGKSTHALFLSGEARAPIVNPDSIRIAIHGEDYIQRAEPYVWATAHTMVHALFAAGHAVVILDAANNTRKRRDEWKRHDDLYVRHFVYIDTHVTECLKRAKGNPKLSPIIERMHTQHEPVTEDEDFEDVRTIGMDEVGRPTSRFVTPDEPMTYPGAKNLSL